MDLDLHGDLDLRPRVTKCSLGVIRVWGPSFHQIWSKSVDWSRRSLRTGIHTYTPTTVPYIVLYTVPFTVTSDDGPARKFRCVADGAPKSDSDTPLLSELAALLHGVCKFIEGQDNDIHKTRLLQMFKLMDFWKFPFKNICLHIFEDLRQYFSVNNICEVRFSPDVCPLWTIGNPGSGSVSFTQSFSKHK